MSQQLISIGKTNAVRPEKIAGIHRLGSRVFVTGSEICVLGQKDRIELRFKTSGEAESYYSQLLATVNLSLAGPQSADAPTELAPATLEPVQA